MKKKERMSEIMKRLEQRIANPKSELNYSSIFELLIAVMLSAQTTDQRVNASTDKLFKIANTPIGIIELGQTNLLFYIRSIGLAKSKSHNIIETCHLLHEKFNDLVPNNYEELLTLPGVGSKTAKVVLNIGFGKPVIAVDTHIKRVSNRLNLSKNADPNKISEDLIKIIDDQYKLNAHHYLLLHGRYTCKARTPNCKDCVLNDLCTSKDKYSSVKNT